MQDSQYYDAGLVNEIENEIRESWHDSTPDVFIDYGCGFRESL